MIQIDINEKTVGSKLLMQGFECRIAPHEKVGLIGRNGTGKTTLFRMICGDDNDYDGIIEIPRNAEIMATLQEHEGIHSTTHDYIASRLPRYTELHKQIDELPLIMGESTRLQTQFSDAIEEFAHRGYYELENDIEKLFNAYQLDEDLIEREFSSLSGGQKRLVDLIAIQIGQPRYALLDEPTNHMDYVAKKVFIEWLADTKSSCLIISHDRDVLQAVDKIIELKDCKSFNFQGNYDSYLQQNSVKTIGAMQSFETTEKRIENIKEQIRYAKIKAKSKAGGNTGRSGKNQWVVLQDRLEKELAEILDNHDKPSFWIDRESADKLAPKLSEKYDKYKAKNIKLKTPDQESRGHILSVESLTLGYDSALFHDLSFTLNAGERLHIIGRNGAGKTTLVKAIMDTFRGVLPSTIKGNGIIHPSHDARISLYEQELRSGILEMTLHDAIESILREKNEAVSDQKIMTLMGSYLFDPLTDSSIITENLSGGQKARLQLIRLLSGSPNLLILDEPTNHLDLPSIEELENALNAYTGAVMFISHDTYFARHLGGKSIEIG